MNTLAPANRPVIVRTADCPSSWLLQDHVTPLLTPDRTGSEIAWAITRTPPNAGTPPHVHRNEDEAFYVLEGEVTFLCGDKLIRATAGSFVWGPRDVIHCFRNTGPTPSTMLLTVTPTEFLKFSQALAEPAPDFGAPPAITPQKLAQLAQVAPAYGIEIDPEHALPTVVHPAPRSTRGTWVMGMAIHYLLTSDQTGNRFTVVEIRTKQGLGPPPHTHMEMDEMFYVIEGAYEFLVGDRTETVEAGGAVFVPAGVRHTFRQVSTGSARLLDLHTPGGFEDFFDEIGAPLDQHAEAPPTPDLSPEQVAAVFAKHGMTL